MFSKDVIFSSLAVPSILLAVETVVVDLERRATTENVMDLLCTIPRVILVKGDMGLHSTDAIFEYFRRVARPSADIYEVCVWHEHVESINSRLKVVQTFDPHCVQTPEVMDTIRALTNKTTLEKSLKLTDKALKILNPGIYP